MVYSLVAGAGRDSSVPENGRDSRAPCCSTAVAPPNGGQRVAPPGARRRSRPLRAPPGGGDRCCADSAALGQMWVCGPTGMRASVRGCVRGTVLVCVGQVCVCAGLLAWLWSMSAGLQLVWCVRKYNGQICQGEEYRDVCVWCECVWTCVCVRCACALWSCL